MATFTLSPNLKLRLDSNLSSSARYNLERLDLLGAAFTISSTDDVAIRSEEDIIIEPASAAAGGDGLGGTVQIGTSSHSIDEFTVNADITNIRGDLNLLDQATSGSKYLSLVYDSTTSGAVDTTADRELKLDLQGANRQLVLGGNLSLAAAFTTVGGHPVSFTTTGAVAWTFPATNGSAGQILSNDGTGILSWADPESGQAAAFTWALADGTSKVITHNFGSNDLEIQIYDVTNQCLTIVDSVVHTSPNTLLLSAVEAPPAGGYQILIREVS